MQHETAEMAARLSPTDSLTPQRQEHDPGEVRNSGLVDSPTAYGRVVEAYAARSLGSCLYSGENYGLFARFLNKPTSNATDRDRFPFSLVCHLQSGVKNRTVYEFPAVDALAAFTEFQTRYPPGPDSLHLVFLRGFPHPKWLQAIGSQYRIDPEFFRRHLRFLFKPKEFYDLPALPSSARNIIRLRVTTICTRQVAVNSHDVQLARAKETEEVDRYGRHLEARGSPGDSIVRRFSIHNETISTIEQDISICVKKEKSGGWIALIWLDSGKDLDGGIYGPWLGSTPMSSGQQPLCLPVIQHKPKMALRSHLYDPAASVPHRVRSSAQSMQLLSTHYGSTLQPEAMRADPTYALSELFAFAASSESQFLNLMQAQVESAITSYEDQEELSRKSLIYNKKLVDEHVRYIRETICSLKSRGESRWPKAKDLETVAESLINLQGDFCHLLERAEHVAARCLEGIEIIINAVQLEEARKGIRQGEEMHRLTILAFFFLPLSLVASIFGMNFTEFGQGHLHIWLAGIVVVPVIAVSVVLGFWDHISEKGRLLRRRSSHLSPAT